MNAMKACWTVQVGVIPENPLEEYCKSFTYTSIDYENDRTCQTLEDSIFYKRQQEAMAYAQRCQHPSSFNWVKIEFMWM